LEAVAEAEPLLLAEAGLVDYFQAQLLLLLKTIQLLLVMAVLVAHLLVVPAV
jgi:hypothetical protein